MSTQNLISTSVTDVKTSLEVQLDSNPAAVAREAIDLLEALQGLEGQTSRRRVAASVLRKAAKAIEVAE